MREIDLGPQADQSKSETLYKDDELVLERSSINVFRRIQEAAHIFEGPGRIEKIIKTQVGKKLGKFFDILALALKDDPRSFERFHEARCQFLTSFADEVKRKRRHRLLTDFVGTLYILGENYPEMEAVLTIEADVLYFLLCEEDKILAGARGGLWWKEISAGLYSPAERSDAWAAISAQMSPFFRHLGKAEIELVPDRFILLENFEKLNLPRPARSIEELLENAYYKQRYVVSPEGAEVHIQKAGDLETVIVKQRGDEVLAKAITTLGEVFVALNLDRAEPISPEVIAKQEPRLAHILAEIYHDLVVAVEIPGPPRKKRRTSTVTPIEERPLSERTYVYIPRKIRVGEEEKEVPFRVPYEGPRRPPRRHGVRPHSRKGNMTEKQEGRVMEFYQQTGIDLLKQLYRSGKTIVLPFIRGGKPEDETLLPIFIKKGIETQRKKDLNRLIEDLKSSRS